MGVLAAFVAAANGSPAVCRWWACFNLYHFCPVRQPSAAGGSARAFACAVAPHFTLLPAFFTISGAALLLFFIRLPATLQSGIAGRLRGLPYSLLRCGTGALCGAAAGLACPTRPTYLPAALLTPLLAQTFGI